MIYKNISLKVKYADDSVLKYRKEISASLMTNGVVVQSAHEYPDDAAPSLHSERMLKENVTE